MLYKENLKNQMIDYLSFFYKEYGADKDDIPKDEEDNLEPSESDRVMEEYERLLASIENNIQKDEGHAVYLALMDGLDDE